jgi:hypothetical protein
MKSPKIFAVSKIYYDPKTKHLEAFPQLGDAVFHDN